MSIFGRFHPETPMTGVARSAELQVAVSVCHSPGQSVISLSLPDPGQQLIAPPRAQFPPRCPCARPRAGRSRPSGWRSSRLTADHDLERHLDRVQLAPGFSYAEEFAGTNGIGTALESGRAAHVFGHEHYAEHLEDLACAAVPIRHPISGKAAGAVNLTSWRKDAGRLLIALAQSTARQFTQGLLNAPRKTPRPPHSDRSPNRAQVACLAGSVMTGLRPGWPRGPRRPPRFGYSQPPGTGNIRGCVAVAAVVHRVAEVLSLRPGRGRLHITQPALSRQIRSSRWLRSSLGVPAGLAVANLIAASWGSSAPGPLPSSGSDKQGGPRHARRAW